MHWFHGQLRVTRKSRLRASFGGLMGPCSKLNSFSVIISIPSFFVSLNWSNFYGRKIRIYQHHSSFKEKTPNVATIKLCKSPWFNTLAIACHMVYSLCCFCASTKEGLHSNIK